MKQILIAILLVLVLAFPAYAGEHFKAGVKAFEDADFQAAAIELEGAILSKESLSKKKMITCRKYLILSLVALGRTNEAESHARALLKLDPNFNFRKDPDYTPKAERLFDQVSSETMGKRMESDKIRNEKIAGWTLVGIGGVSAIGAVVSYLAAAESYKLADKEADNDKRDAYEQTMNRNLYFTYGLSGLAVVTAGVGTGLLVHASKRQALFESKNAMIDPLFNVGFNGESFYGLRVRFN